MKTPAAQKISLLAPCPDRPCLLGRMVHAGQFSGNEHTMLTHIECEEHSLYPKEGKQDIFWHHTVTHHLHYLTAQPRVPTPVISTLHSLSANQSMLHQPIPVCTQFKVVNCQHAPHQSTEKTRVSDQDARGLRGE